MFIDSEVHKIQKNSERKNQIKGTASSGLMHASRSTTACLYSTCIGTGVQAWGHNRTVMKGLFMSCRHVILILFNVNQK